jgi:hypothetical protein
MKWGKMEFCCQTLYSLTTSAGYKGVAILVRNTNSHGLSFVLQTRGVSAKDEVKLKGINADVTVLLKGNLPLTYCPFCGKRLEDLLKEKSEFFQTLAEQHRELVDISE